MSQLRTLLKSLGSSSAACPIGSAQRIHKPVFGNDRSVSWKPDRTEERSTNMRAKPPPHSWVTKALSQRSRAGDGQGLDDAEQDGQVARILGNFLTAEFAFFLQTVTGAAESRKQCCSTILRGRKTASKTGGIREQVQFRPKATNGLRRHRGPQSSFWIPRRHEFAPYLSSHWPAIAIC